MNVIITVMSSSATHLINDAVTNDLIVFEFKTLGIKNIQRYTVSANDAEFLRHRAANTSFSEVVAKNGIDKSAFANSGLATDKNIGFLMLVRNSVSKTKGIILEFEY